MEVLISGHSSAGHFYEAGRHGVVWLVLNKILHIIVFVFALFGMVRFKVKFIKAVRLVRFVSALIVVHSWYIAIKFALIALLMYFFNLALESRELSLNHFNCSLSNADFLFRAFRPIRSKSAELTGSAATEADPLVSVAIALALDHFGGPYRLLGNRATLMYGFYAIAIFIMLAIFPIELRYLDIGFNHIRFVLNDITCLKDLYANRQKHLDRLNLWSRTRYSSITTLSMKRAITQRDLRCRHAAEYQVPVDTRRGRRDKSAERELQLCQADLQRHNRQLEKADIEFPDLAPPSSPFVSSAELPQPSVRILVNSQYPTVLVERTDKSPKRQRPVRSLKQVLETNHYDEPSYSVRVANQNLRNFKPHVRSDTWFKSSMVVYPTFVLFYFVTLTVVIGAISIYFTSTMIDIQSKCVQQGFASSTSWSLLDQLTFYETQYCVFALSCASCFYCSYYFGTIIELYGWVLEIAQQLVLCKIVLQLKTDPLLHLFSGFTNELNQVEAHVYGHQSAALAAALKDTDQFGGIANLWSHLKFRKTRHQSERLKRYELMALQLLNNKQTLFRAAYINLNLFFDELSETRFMTQTILGRTTHIAFGFALMVGITRSQFESKIIYLNILLLSCLAILNLYLICAAMINNNINKLLPRIHSLICESIVVGTDHDLIEFWLRHIQAYGVDGDSMSYRIFGYKVTWRSIVTFDGAVISAYLFTIYN